MPDKQWWEPIYRIDALWGLYGLAVAISGGATTVAAFFSTSESLTSWVWLVTFFGGTVALAIAFALTRWAWTTFLRPTTPIPDTKDNTPSDGTSTPRGAEQSGEPVLFEIRGAWLNTPFACQSLGTNEKGELQYGEDINLTIIVFKLLENVRLTISIKDTAEAKTKMDYHHQGIISGTVTPGMSEQLRVFRRTFAITEVGIQHSDDMRVTHEYMRRDVGASFLEGLAEKAVLLSDIYNVDITLYHRQGQQHCSLNIDLRPITAPRSRLIYKRGNLYIGAPNNYTAPEFPPSVI